MIERMQQLLDSNVEFGALRREHNSDWTRILGTFGHESSQGRKELEWDAVPEPDRHVYFERMARLETFPEHFEYMRLADEYGSHEDQVTATEKENLRLWFGASKLIDEKGHPLVLYHGTDASISTFSPSEQGLFGRGIYLTTDAQDAEQYGPAIPLYAKLERPFYTKADYGAGEEIDFDSPAVPFIREVFGSEADDLLRKAMAGDGDFGQEVQEQLESWGHDGIVVEWPDGLRHVIAFHPEQVKSATQNNGDFDPAEPDIRRSFAGPLANSADTMALSTAQQRLGVGDDAEAVRKETGWFQGNDGKWRFEISDADASLGHGYYDMVLGYRGRTALALVLDHPALFAAYPSLRDITVQRMDLPANAIGNFDETTRTIHLSNRLNSEESLSVLLHEIQHGIQYIEGFATGGSPGQLQKSLLSEELRKQAQEFVNLEDLARSSGMSADYAAPLAGLSKEAAARVQELVSQGLWEANVASWKRELLEPREAYIRLAGEVEARNTQTRRALNADQRRDTPPRQTADVADSDVIIAFGGKVSQNATATATSTAFQRWFGASKVVDDGGKPRIVYHGSPQVGFTEFDTGNTAAFFTDRFDIAATYAGRFNEVEYDEEGAYADDDQGVYDAHLRIENPLVLDWEGRDWGDGPEGLKLDDWAGRAKRAGHDGLIVENVVDTGWLAPGLAYDNAPSTVYAVFQPEQIKSASSNNGEFDPSKQDIRRSAKRTGSMPSSTPERGGSTPAQGSAVAFADVIVVLNGKEIQNAPPPANSTVRPTGQDSGATVADVRASITKAYGNLLPQLESKGLATITQTQEQAITAAAQARAKEGGGDVEEIKRSLMASVYKSIRAWHGSPHRFDNFSLERIGTGEGVQAYGWGLYFASTEEVANFYRRAGETAAPVQYLGEGIINWALGNREVAQALPKLTQRTLAWTRDFASIEQAMEMARMDSQWDVVEEISRLADAGLLQNTPIGPVYDVRILSTEDDFLLWDKPLSEQPQKVQDALEQLRMETGLATPVDALGEVIYRALTDIFSKEGRDRVRNGEFIADTHAFGQRLASEHLADLGIKGIKYLDGNSRSRGYGTFNYVVFDDADVAILDIKFSANGSVQGFFDPKTGRSFMVADNLTAQTAPGVLMHEVGIHIAASVDLQPVFARAKQLLEQERSDPFIQRVQARMDSAKETSGEEAAAYIVEEYENDRAQAPASVIRWVIDFVADVRAWFYKKGLIETADGLSAADIAAIARANATHAALSPSDGDVRFSRAVSKPASTFYSQLRRVFEQIPDRLKTMTARGWAQWLNANASKLGVKAEELEYSGIRDYLDTQGENKLTREDLARYMQVHGVKVEEVVLEGEKGRNGSDEWEVVRNGSEDYEVVDGAGSLVESNFSSRQSAQEFIDSARSTSNTKYGKYTLPGGENYREVLLTLPVKKAKDGGIPPGYRLIDVAEEDRADGLNIPLDEVGPWRFNGPNVASRIYKTRDEALAALLKEASDQEDGAPYQSDHWGQPNVLAHIRVNDRVDADGKRVLFVEELQSDWSAEGRKKGFQGAKVKGYQDQWEGRPISTYETKAEADAHLARARTHDADAPVAVVEIETTRHSVNEAAEGKVPKAPFVTKTEGWLNLALKRVITMAVDGGYDKVAFVSGQQSADRYDLSKQIDMVQVGRKEGSGAWDIRAYKPGSEVPDIAKEAATIDEVADILGKEIAGKLEDLQPGQERKLQGVDLQVGGDGMLAFYDQLLPQQLNKLLPKLGGEKAGLVRILNPDAGPIAPTEQTGFTITDRMRQTVGAGVPLFSRKSHDVTRTPEFERWFGGSKVVDNKGAPRVVYHGTASDFATFSPSKAQDKHGRKLGLGWGKGKFYFASTGEAASSSAQFAAMTGRGKHPNVMPVYLSLRNPIQAADYMALVEGLQASGKTRDQAIAAVDKKIMAAGHDGILDDVSGGIAVFRPEQIKSATGNNGNFNQENLDICFSRKGQPPASNETAKHLHAAEILAWERFKPIAAEQGLRSLESGEKLASASVIALFQDGLLAPNHPQFPRNFLVNATQEDRDDPWDDRPRLACVG